MTDRLDNIEHVEAKATSSFDRVVKVTGDTADRFEQMENGDMRWGGGSGAMDVVLGRTAAGVLGFTSGGLGSAATVSATAATLAVTAALHDRRIINLNKVDGIAVTLPAATGSGARFEFVIGATITSVGTTIKVANAQDAFIGMQFAISDNSAAVLGYIASANSDDTITLNGTTTGGYAGDRVSVIDLAANQWSVLVMNKGTGTEATCFSATV